MLLRRTSRVSAAVVGALGLAALTACSGITDSASNDTLAPLVPGNTGPPVTQLPAVGPDGQPVVNTQGSTTTIALAGDPAALEADDGNPLSVAARFLAAAESGDSSVGATLEAPDRSPTVFDWAEVAYQQYTDVAGAQSWGDPTCTEPTGSTVLCSWLSTDAAPRLLLVAEGTAWRVSHPVFNTGGDAEPATVGTGCIVGSSSVNFRGGPGTNWPRFTQIQPGACSITLFDSVESDPTDGEQWRLVEVNGQRGWIVDRVIRAQ